MKRSSRIKLVKSSTLAFWKESRRTHGYSLFDFIHGYLYGSWPYLYIGIGTGEHRLSKVLGPLWGFLGRLLWPAQNDPGVGENSGSTQSRGQAFADAYHGKVMPLASITHLVTVNEAIRKPDLEKIIPYSRARSLILSNPDHIVALECPCRSARKNPCLPLDVCLIVGEPFASFVAEHHPKRSRWIQPGDAVDILQAEDARGHVHHAFFKDAMLDRFYAICNCCSCCCGAMQAQRNGVPMLASSGYTCQVDADLCIGCGDCNQFCQFEALSLNGYQSHVDYQKCMGCGVCVSKCEQGALSLYRDVLKGEPLDIKSLSS